MVWFSKSDAIIGEYPVSIVILFTLCEGQKRRDKHIQKIYFEEIGRQFGIAKYSSVSSAIEKMKREISADRRLKARVKIIEKIL